MAEEKKKDATTETELGKKEAAVEGNDEEKEEENNKGGATAAVEEEEVEEIKEAVEGGDAATKEEVTAATMIMENEASDKQVNEVGNASSETAAALLMLSDSTDDRESARADGTTAAASSTIVALAVNPTIDLSQDDSPTRRKSRKRKLPVDGVSALDIAKTPSISLRRTTRRRTGSAAYVASSTAVDDFGVGILSKAREDAVALVTDLDSHNKTRARKIWKFKKDDGGLIRKLGDPKEICIRKQDMYR